MRVRVRIGRAPLAAHRRPAYHEGPDAGSEGDRRANEKEYELTPRLHLHLLGLHPHRDTIKASAEMQSHTRAI